MVKNYIVTIRLDEQEYMMVTNLSKNLNTSKSEVFRRLLWTVRILFDPSLTAKDALTSIVDNSESLGDILKPLPELIRIIASKSKNK